MADLEAKREARRRRILQSSEDRMNRVLGVKRDIEGQDSSLTSPGDAECTETVTQQLMKPTEDEAVETNSVLRQRIKTSDGEKEDSGGGDTLVPLQKNTVKISPLKPPASKANESSFVDESRNTSRSTSDAKMMLKHFEFLRIVLCFMVAFICRKVLATGYGIFYVQSIILPYICLEAVFFMFKHKVLHNITLPHRSSMLVGVLLLCGMKPGILQTYNKIMGYFTAASEDFAMFFFAFMVSNMFVSSPSA